MTQAFAIDRIAKIIIVAIRIFLVKTRPLFLIAEFCTQRDQWNFIKKHGIRSGFYNPIAKGIIQHETINITALLIPRFTTPACYWVRTLPNFYPLVIEYPYWLSGLNLQ